jgi:coenzyme F420-0:L-glutamate ligase/coenzyme F420-1:gamma-L-glutamate ligase
MTLLAARSPGPVTLTPLLRVPEVRAGDDLAALILDALPANGIELRDGDILVISSKVVSKALGLTVAAGDRDAAVLSQARRVVAERDTPLGITRVVEAVAGPVMAAAGVDASNTGTDDVVLLLPEDPDAVARTLRKAIQRRLPGLAVGLVLSDTAGRPWRVGQTDFALGSAGVRLVDDLRGGRDADGRPLGVTERCVGDEIAAAADLVKGKTSRVPVAHVRGLGSAVERGNDEPGSRTLVRTGPSDWFGSGQVEAVRAALGVEAGTTLATEVGVPSALPEPRATRLQRAGRIALLQVEGVAARAVPEGIVLEGEDAFTLGIAVSRLVVALHAEGLAATAGRPATTGPRLQARVTLD